MNEQSFRPTFSLGGQFGDGMPRGGNAEHAPALGSGVGHADHVGPAVRTNPRIDCSNQEALMTTVVVFGATGYAGSAITSEARSRGMHVVAVARNTASLAPAEDLTVAAGSVFDADFVRRTIADADADEVVVALHAVGADGEQLIDALPVLVDASVAAGARLSFVGGAGSLLVADNGTRLLDTPEFPEAFAPEARSHAAILEALRASAPSLDWFYVSPAASFGSYNPGERTGVFRVGGDRLMADDNGNSEISGADFAIAYADELERQAHHRQRFSVAY